MNSWTTVPFGILGDRGEAGFALGPFGSKVTTKDYVASGVPFIRGVNLGGGRFRDEGFVFLDEATAREVESAAVASGDLVFTRKGTIGQVSMIPRASRFPSYVISSSQMKARLDENKALPEFYYYWFRSPQGQHALLANASQVGVPSIANSLSTLRRILVPFPSRVEQQAIAEVLGALDDKIAFNERIASTARELCRAVMQELWIRGGFMSLTREVTTARHNWRRVTLGKLCAAGGGAIQTGPFGSQLHASDYVDSGIPSVMPQNIGDNFISEEGIARITAADAERLSKYLLAEGDIVYSRRGDVKRRALVRKYEAGWLCGTGCLRVRVGSAAEPLFISYYLGEPEIQEWIAQHAVGATMPNLNTAILGGVPVVLPPGEEVRRINERLAGPDAVAAHMQHENRTLADLRDTLLPQLLSGQLRVKDAIRTVEEVV
ncbi:restriction endonuclease subunit S [Streptomyces sp. NPDC001544]|uniref:restriction endonuclease subunit S n=1 Tax=Streptomyces sp. NPDC001544 TaxID=3364584 RepID=UPI0036883298